MSEIKLIIGPWRDETAIGRCRTIKAKKRHFLEVRNPDGSLSLYALMDGAVGYRIGPSCKYSYQIHHTIRVHAEKEPGD